MQHRELIRVTKKSYQKIEQALTGISVKLKWANTFLELLTCKFVFRRIVI